ncbi:MAG: restriction endonuclease [Nitrosopumilaceae archaeon]|nr:restriction endonuclease [Nitrosopumilaceae archaeon]
MFLVLRRRRRNRADRVLFEMGVRDINVMDGIAFERFLEALFRRFGYVSEATQASGDYGVDVLLRRKKRRIAVQAKHYSAPVGLSAVQEAHAGMSFYGAGHHEQHFHKVRRRALPEDGGPPH